MRMAPDYQGGFHASKFIDAGGSVQELAEAIALVSYIRGVSTFEMIGVKMVKAAEKRAKQAQRMPKE